MRQRLDHAVIDYQVERNTQDSPFHTTRMDVTSGLVAWTKPRLALDPACGEGDILLNANRMRPFRGILNDVSQPNAEHVASLAPEGWLVSHMDAMSAIDSAGDVDVIVLTEFLEHVEDPVSILRHARDHATWLVASSPEMRPGQIDSNHEHLWMFDADGYIEILNESGWKAVSKTFLSFGPTCEYDFQIWVCR